MSVFFTPEHRVLIALVALIGAYCARSKVISLRSNARRSSSVGRVPQWRAPATDAIAIHE